MNFNPHLELEGRHAFLSPSNYYWLNYDKEKLINTYKNMRAKEKGTEDHAFAAICIKRRQRIYKMDINLANYVNDAIGFRMTPEQILKYSDNCFGTADAISFRKNELRIHDLKTGTIHQAKMDQLEIYAALFCLEYKVNPYDIFIELRIYQFGDVYIHNPEPSQIENIMNLIKEFDEELRNYQEEMDDV